MRARPVLAAVAMVVVVVVVAAAGVPARAEPLPPLPKVVTYRADIQVGARIEVTRNVDTRASCTPGQKYTLVNRGGMAYDKAVKVTVIDDVVAVPGRAAGVSTADARVTSYAESNYCAPSPAADLHEPACSDGHDGKGRVAFASDSPKRRNRVLIELARIGGGSEGQDCAPPFLTPVDEDAGLGAFDGSTLGMAFSLDLRGHSFATLGRGKSLRRLMRISGPCDAVRVTHGPRPPLLGGTPCFVDGTVDVRIKRR